jgi:hypothetical protein
LSVDTPRDTAAMPEDTWNSRDLPVRQTVIELYDESGTYLARASAVEQSTGGCCGSTKQIERRDR